MRFVLWGLAGFVAIILGYLLFWPTPVSPVAWTPPPNPGFAGVFASNSKLSEAVRFAEGEGEGPEDTTIGPDRLVYAGYADGRIVRVPPLGEEVEVIADTGGRPLGMQFDFDGNLIIADAIKGLVQLSPDGELKVLLDQIDGKPILFADDLDIASDGTIWFSDASQRYGIHDNLLDFWESRPTGRLISYNPANGAATVHVDGLAFANGVALGPDEAYVLINETFRARITRYWLKGEKAGTTDTFVTGLPGYNDNLSFNGRDTFWVALVYPRSPELEDFAGRPFLRKVLARIPGFFASAPPHPYGWVVGIHTDGRIIHNLQDPLGRYTTITSVNEFDGQLYLGSLTEPAIARIPVPE